METLQLAQDEKMLNNLLLLYQCMQQNGDEENAKKIKDLLKKTASRDFVVAFCGHFSAGKSSMINELLGEECLPTSPIPTSANVVKIKKGTDYIKVFYKDELPLKYEGPYDFDIIRQLCKDGDAVSFIEMSRKDVNIPNGISVLDTPGIDSTDNAHRMATESILHLADIIFYVMDYNHVLSEVNFHFVKELTKHHRSIYLVVNQIDKFREEELDFSDFKKTVSTAFEEWGIPSEKIFYTSLRNKNHPFNELNDLKHCITNMLKNNHRIFIENVRNMAKDLISRHALFIDEKKSEQKEKLQIQLETLSSEEKEQLPVLIKELEQQAGAVKTEVSRIDQTFREELETILNNAYIMPYETREFARLYLEACQPEFKVGFLFSKSKTEKERSERLQKFYHDFSEKITSQLLWHVKELLIKTINELNIANHQLQGKVHSFQVTIESDLLDKTRKQGARVTGDYVLNYTGDLVNEVKRIYREKTLSFFEEILQELNIKLTQQFNMLQEKLQYYQKQYEAYLQLLEIEKEKKETYNKLMALLNSESHSIQTDQLSLHLQEEIRLVHSLSHHVQNNEHEQSSQEKINESKTETIQQTSNHKQTISKIKKVAQLLKNVQGFSAITKTLSDKAARLEEQKYTVALFGAFSAGKSSFANALLGNKVLPVSPNPTTAAINHILPVTKDFPHGTVRIKMKTENQLLEDILFSLQAFDEKADHLEEAMTMIENIILSQQKGEEEKVHIAFLTAVLSGFDKVKPVLGKELVVGLEEFREYVANEEKAAFVDSIMLYYDCPLTRKGISLVDTPGADSINARHTGVAFDYIKNADAVLFVTYYNHAFSKADREFLIQLGRVKDTFSMDKMFFIINAADLASSTDELNAVKKYVEDQLLTFGIRHPRLFALSSQLALAEKINGKETIHHEILTASGLEKFEAVFEHFILNEIHSMSVLSAIEDIKKAKRAFDEYITLVRKNKEEREEKLVSFSQIQKQLFTIIQDSPTIFFERSISQEIEELVYYIHQRVFLRYPDFFKESFNPAVLRNDDQSVLQKCMKELLQSMGYDLAQEMRATALRVEKFVTNKLLEFTNHLIEKLLSVYEGLPLSSDHNWSFETPQFAIALRDLTPETFAKALSMYKNAKSFFEKNEKQKMSAEIEKILHQPVKDYLIQHQKLMEGYYLQEFRTFVEDVKSQLTQDIRLYFEGVQAALTEQNDMEFLQSVHRELDQIIEQLR
jgi:small GTP-binding protein